MASVTLETTVTCPECRHRFSATMPEDSCVQALACPECKHTIRREAPHCCVFCTHGDDKCPPEQKA